MIPDLIRKEADCHAVDMTEGEIALFYSFVNKEQNSFAELIENKFKKKILIKNVKIIVYSLVVIGFIAIFIYTNVLNNDNGVVPYQTIFSKGFKIK